MHQQIVQEAFAKTKVEVEQELGTPISRTKTSQYLSTYLLDEYNVIYGDKSLREAFKKPSCIKRPEVLRALCNYLGYENYSSYQKTQVETHNVHTHHRMETASPISKEKNKQQVHENLRPFQKLSNKLSVYQSYAAAVSMTLVICLIAILWIRKDAWMMEQETNFRDFHFPDSKILTSDRCLNCNDTNFELRSGTTQIRYYIVINGAGQQLNSWNANSQLPLYLNEFQFKQLEVTPQKKYA
jgi:hypothetical protein